MTMFGIVVKEDGAISIHFDEGYVISCAYHLGKVSRCSHTSSDYGDSSGNSEG